MGRIVFLVLALVARALAAPPTAPRPPVVVTSPWVTASCWIEPRWFETLRSGPLDYCKRGLRYRPGKLDCLSFNDEVCWANNVETGEWTQLRTPGHERLVVCPEGPEAPTCPRLRVR